MVNMLPKISQKIILDIPELNDVTKSPTPITTGSNTSEVQQFEELTKLLGIFATLD